jgi:serine/threonine protein kinase
MEATHWQQAKEIFNAALDLPPQARHAFTARACAGDADLQQLVETLLLADNDAGSFMKTGWLKPSVTSPRESYLAPGDVVSGRYRIVRPLGDGGMGQVYEAVDSELNVCVALKTIRPEIASNPEVLVRFRQEVRLAHQITHPNICRTFHLDHEVRKSAASASGRVEINFLTMEYLPGVTLRSLLKQGGPLAPQRALAVARQVADGIDAAHRAGIIHRDIKPANIMIVPAQPSSRATGGEERVVITDFGLARWQVADPDASMLSQHSITIQGQALGTPSYMAPEQLQGGGVTPATDIYAFGLVLYEMVTGEKLSPQTRWLSPAPQATEALSPALSGLPPGSGSEWRIAISGCLHANPAARFQSANEVIAALEGGAPATRKKAVTPWHQLILSALLLAIAVSLSIVGLRLYGRRQTSNLSEGTVVYLAPVKNETGIKRLDHADELLRAGLQQSPQISLLDAGRAAEILQQMTKSPTAVIDQPAAREVAMRAGATRVIFTTFTASQNELSLKVDIQQPDNQPLRFRRHWDRTWSWPASPTTATSPTMSHGLLSAVRDAADWIRKSAGETPDEIGHLGTPPEDATTSSWEALDDYMRARQLAAQNQRVDAILALQQAVRADPDFAFAYGYMGDILLSLHRDLEGFHAYDQALDAGLRNRLTRREEDRIRGMRAIDTADYQIAIDAFHDYSINYKDDYFGWVYAARPLHMLGRDAEAIGVLTRAISLQPRKPYARYALAIELILVDRREEALPWIESLRADGETDLANEAELLLRFLDHRYDDASRLLQSLHQSASPMRRSYSFGNAACLAAETGHYQQGIALLNQGLREDETQGNSAEQAMHLLDRAYLEYKLREFSEALRDVQAGYSLNPTPATALKADTVLGDMVASGPASRIHAFRSELVEIQRSLAKEDYGSLAVVVRLRTLGEIQLAEGKIEPALNSFRRAALKDAPAAGSEYLARALVAAARRQPDPARARRLLQEAMQDYAVVALHAALVWSVPSDFLPGSYADQLQQFVRLADQLQVVSPESITARSGLQTIRSGTPTSPAPIPQPTTHF